MLFLACEPPLNNQQMWLDHWGCCTDCERHSNSKITRKRLRPSKASASCEAFRRLALLLKRHRVWWESVPAIHFDHALLSLPALSLLPPFIPFSLCSTHPLFALPVGWYWPLYQQMTSVTDPLAACLSSAAKYGAAEKGMMGWRMGRRG